MNYDCLRLPLLLTTPALALATALVAMPAHAGIAACGNIHVEAEAECEVVAGGGCQAKCTPLAVEASCAADLQLECGGSCSADASVECTTDCQPTCEAECEVAPADFDCGLSCQADCEGSCDAACDAGDGECQASCSATCSAECDASCSAEASADCEAQCSACCGGSCTADANIDCQVECQAEGFATCKAEVQGGCEVACEKPEGALFCDGQYVDHGGNLAECAAALRALFDIEVEGHAEGSCSNGKCMGEAEGSLGISCSASDAPSRSLAWLVLGLPLLNLRRPRK